jgi:hypothetical protein
MRTRWRLVLRIRLTIAAEPSRGLHALLKGRETAIRPAARRSFAEKGLHMLDAPVSGGPARGEAAHARRSQADRSQHRQAARFTARLMNRAVALDCRRDL